MSDQNPIPYLIATVAIRFWLSIILVGQSAITETAPSILDWLALYVLGTVADFPLIVNVILFLVTDGSLLLWLVLLLKRIANPLAN